MKDIKKILVANRGEIAVRIIKTIRSLGLQSVAIYSDLDGSEAFHCRMADECFPLRGSDLAETYLNIEKILRLAYKSGAGAIHPGYGFLAENQLFAAACEDKGIKFIGPPSHLIRLMGNKVESRAAVQRLGIPVIEQLAANVKEILDQAETLDYPVLIKSAAGGGGKGMRLVESKEELTAKLETTSFEAASYFGDGGIYLEKYMDPVRHIEFQVLGDQHGNVIHLHERECSIQRRHQKIIEESPSAFLSEDTRKKMSEAAVTIATQLGYQNAGTIEFLLEGDQHFYFLEMNTRIQVEHPVTEMTTGVDLVREQILIAMDQVLTIKQENVMPQGHAIEARIYAENPLENYRPSPGNVVFYREPSGTGLRVDACMDKPAMIWSEYDPLIAKIVAHGDDRPEAISRLKKALQEYPILGIDTNILYLSEILGDMDYVDNQISTLYCDTKFEDLKKRMISHISTIRGDVFRSGFLAATLANQEKSMMAGESVSPFHSLGYWRQINVLRYQTGEESESVCIISNQQCRLVYQFEGEIFEVDEILADMGQIWFTFKGIRYAMHHSVKGTGDEILEFKHVQKHFKRSDSLAETPFVQVKDDKVEQNNTMIVSPMYGKIINMNVSEDDKVLKGDLLFTMDSMKTENNILAPRNARIRKIMIGSGEQVEVNKPVLLID